MSVWKFFLVLIVGIAWLSPLYAQPNFGLHEKAAERLSAAGKVDPVMVDGAFGEQVSSFNGGTEFSVTDISIPGNFGLPVELRRTLRVVDRYRPNGRLLGGFEDWDLDVPHLSGVFWASMGWQPVGGTVNERCSLPRVPVGPWAMAAEDFWDGYQLHVPGQGDQALLVSPSAMLPAAGGGPHPWITKSMWRISCKSATANGYPGQAFIAHSPDGIRYHLDWGIERDHANIKNDGNGYGVSRKVVLFLVSRIEDRFGNWVNLNWSGDKLISITANDGRQITINWSGSHIVLATSSVGSWGYSYLGNQLHQAVRPDGSRWIYTSSGGMAMMPPSWSPVYEDPTGCPEGIDEGYTGSYTLSIMSPSGATGTFVFRPVQHWRSSVPESCVIVSPKYYYLKIPRYHWSLTLISKTVTAPSLPAMVWNYMWGQPDVYSGDDTRMNVVAGPNGTWARYTYGTGVHLNEGQLLKMEQGGGQANILRTETYSYLSNAEAGGQNFPARVGYNPLEWSDQLSVAWLRPLKKKVITHQGVNFNWQVDAECGGKFCFDVFARPIRSTQSSTLPGAPARTEEITRYDNTVLWVLGQIAQVKCVAPVTAIPFGCGSAGIVIAENSYDPALALPMVNKSFGKTVRRLTYETSAAIVGGQRGTLKTVEDGNGHIISLGDWKRGIPQHIRFADGTTQSAVVNDAGWITAVTDENGFATGYGYDLMGRLSAVTPPSGDTVAWNTVTTVFAPAATAAYGLSAGHWRSTESVGNKRVVTYYDGLWRPVVVEQYDSANVAATRSVVIKRYDHENRLVYQSYPRGDITAWSDTHPGIHTSYDPLGRVTQVAQDSEHGSLLTRHEYLNGLEVRTTNPRGFQSVNGYIAYDQPNYDLLAWSVQPEGKTLEILRDVFGKPLSITQRNADSTQSVIRRYVYDGHQQLCKTLEPETGATVMDYDAAGNLVWLAAGLDLPSTTACDRTDARVAARKSLRAYDARNRITSLWFPDGRGNQSWQYTPDGLVARSVVDNDGPSRATVINEYVYNKRRVLIGESQTQPGWYAWSLGYGYNVNGHLSTQRYPNGLVVNYQSNALGQPTRVADTAGQTYASGVRYHPDGAIHQFTYGNGLVHTMTQNTRQLPQRIASSGGVLNDVYSYDANANPESIIDTLLGEGNYSVRSRWMQYDGLDRLTATGSGAFGGDNWHRFTYDALDNLRSDTLSGVKDYARYGYDANNRLVSISNSANATVVTLGYDVQGNLSNKNGQRYDFDFGNRLKVVPGVESYRYDAYGRRVQSWAPGKDNVLNMYSRSGNLMYQQDERRGQALAYVYLAGSQIARIRKDGKPPSPPTPPVSPVFGPPVLKASRVVTTPPQIGIALDWNTVPEAVTYELVTDIPLMASPFTLYEGSGTTYFLERMLMGSFRVRACRASGECSGWSNTVNP